MLSDRFLYHKTSPEYQYYEARVRELEGGKSGTSMAGPPVAQPQLRPPAAPAEQPVQPPPRVNRFSESKPDGERSRFCLHLPIVHALFLMSSCTFLQ